MIPVGLKGLAISTSVAGLSLALVLASGDDDGGKIFWALVFVLALVAVVGFAVVLLIGWLVYWRQQPRPERPRVSPRVRQRRGTWHRSGVVFLIAWVGFMVVLAVLVSTGVIHGGGDASCHGC